MRNNKSVQKIRILEIILVILFILTCEVSNLLISGVIVMLLGINTYQCVKKGII